MQLFEKKNKEGGVTQDVNTSPPAKSAQETLSVKTQEQAADTQGMPALSYLTLFYQEDGVYMSLTMDRMPNAKDQQDVLQHLVRKDIKDLDGAALQKALIVGRAEDVLIAPAQEEKHYDAMACVSVEANQMEAYLVLLPPEEGIGKALNEENVLRELTEKHRLVYGLDIELVKHMLKNELYDEKRLIAKGMGAMPGEDGALIFHFDHLRTGDASVLRQVDDDEKVDFKELDLFEQVKKDQLLVTKIPPKDGVPGRTVTGIEVSAPQGKTYNLPVGKNTYQSDDKLNMYAKTDGRVDYINGNVEVSNCYIVQGNVDMRVGNLDFNGDVEIHGNILNDFKVKATGNIEVMGIVESALVEAGKDIIIRGGMQGSGRGMLIAGGGVFVRFVEYATVQAADIVVAESLLHSNVNCFGPVEVLNGRGSVVGGNVCAGTYIAARFIGNASGRSTLLEVGVSPAHKAQLLEAEESVTTLRDVVSKLQRIVQLPVLSKENERQKAARIEAMRRLLMQKKLLDEALELSARLHEQIEEMKDGQVHVIVNAYPGTMIHMAFERYLVQTPITYATFRLEPEGISFTSCRFKQTSSKIRRIKKR